MDNHFLGVVGETDPFDHDRAAEVIREYMRTTLHRHLLTSQERCSIMDGLEEALREAGLVAQQEDDGDPAVVPAWARRLIDRFDRLERRLSRNIRY